MRKRRQIGSSSLNVLLSLLVVACAVLFLSKVIPAQYNNYYVVASLKSLHNTAGSLGELSDQEIRKQLSSFFNVNGIDTRLLQELQINREDDEILITINYEVREKFYRNIEVVTYFENEWDSSRPQHCCSPST